MAARNSTAPLPRRRDWAALDQRHRQRGVLAMTLIFDPAVLAPPPQSEGHRGRPLQYSDALIEAACLLRSALNLPFRALEGVIVGLYQAKGLKHLTAPDHTVICRRMRTLRTTLRPPLKAGSGCVLVDSTGLKLRGQGEWNARKHGVQGRRSWIKLHLLTDEKTGEILSMIVTDKDEHDSPVLPRLIEGRDLSGKTLIGDGAYDTKRCYAAVHGAGGKLLAPTKLGARRWDRSNPAFRQRNTHINNQSLVGRAKWKAWAKYHRRSKVESSMHRLKQLTGDKVRSRTPERIMVECRLRCEWLNTLIAPAESIAW